MLDEENGLLVLHLAGGRDTFVYQKPDFEPATYTILNFQVEDVDKAVDDLTSRGVNFEQYDDFDQDEKGIARGMILGDRLVQGSRRQHPVGARGAVGAAAAKSLRRSNTKSARRRRSGLIKPIPVGRRLAERDFVLLQHKPSAYRARGEVDVVAGVGPGDRVRCGRGVVAVSAVGGASDEGSTSANGADLAARGAAGPDAVRRIEAIAWPRARCRPCATTRAAS